MNKSLTRAERTKLASAKRREAKKEETRRAILDAATNMFLASGHDNFSLRQVAETIGYSPTTIYLYFKDKDELLFQAAVDGFAKFGRALQDAYDSSTEPWQRLLAEGAAYVTFGLENPVHYRLMFMGRGELLDKELPQEDCDSVSDSFQILVKTVEECLAAGIMKPGDSRVYATLIWAGVHGIVSLSLATPNVSKQDAYDLLDLYKEVSMNALRQ